MARLFNGTSDSLVTASSLTLGSPTKIAVSFWLWWDTYANNDNLAMEYSATIASFFSTWQVDPNLSTTGNFSITIQMGNAANYCRAVFTRPSAGAWHHYLFNADTTLASGCIPQIYVDGAAASITYELNSAGTSNPFTDDTLYLMCRDNTSLFGSGRMGDLAIWTGINLSSTDASNLNSGTLPPSIQSANLKYYWKICGVNSPETATTGSVNFTVNGTSQTPHPSAITASCSGPSAAQLIPVFAQGMAQPWYSTYV